jgi:hypothetical protein
MRQTEEEKREELLLQLNQYAVISYRNGKNSYEIKTELINKGVDNDTATKITEGLDKQDIGSNNGRAQRDLLIGAIFTIGGIGLSLVGSYIFIGAIIFGVIRIGRGLSGWA